MSKAYEMISESLNEIIKDLEENVGKNLKREVMSKEKLEQKKIFLNDNQNLSENFIEPAIY